MKVFISSKGYFREFQFGHGRFPRHSAVKKSSIVLIFLLKELNFCDFSKKILKREVLCVLTCLGGHIIHKGRSLLFQGCCKLWGKNRSSWIRRECLKSRATQLAELECYILTRLLFDKWLKLLFIIKIG